MNANSFAARRGHNKHKLYARSTWAYLSMLAPAIILLLLFNYIPMAGVIIAFQRFVPAKGLFSPNQQWVGFQQFRMTFADPFFSQAIGNTVFLSMSKILLLTISAIAVALFLNELQNDRHKRIVQTSLYLPHFLSWIILSTVLRDMLSSEGIINVMLTNLGMKTVSFMSDNHVFPWVLIMSDVWKEFGFNSIIYLAAITSIDPTLYEATYVDGANKWQQVRHVTLPGIMNIIVLLALLNLGGILNANFDQVFNMYSPNVYKSGDVIDTLIYRKGIEGANYSLATAVGLFKSAISFVLISFSYFGAYKYADYRIF